MLTERRQAEELMDDPALDAGTYQKVLSDLARVNAITMAYRPTIRFIERAVGNRKSFSLLDVGFGDGDMLRKISRWAEDHGIDANLAGVDLNARSKAVAEAAQTTSSPIQYLTGDYADLAGSGFDCIISSLVTHHMTEPQISDFLAFMEREAAAGWFINDLHRHGFAYAGWPVLAGIMRWHPIVRSDGHTSIARSFRPAEWRERLMREGIVEAKVQRWFPFRLCVERLH